MQSLQNVDSETTVLAYANLSHQEIYSITLNNKETSSKLSPFAAPTDAQFFNKTNIPCAIFCMFDFNDGNGYFNNQPKHLKHIILIYNEKYDQNPVNTQFSYTISFKLLHSNVTSCTNYISSHRLSYIKYLSECLIAFNAK